jgi:hypothetical protein
MYAENEHIDDTKLRSLETSGGFTIPMGYFEQLPSHILAQTAGSVKVALPIPEGYFEQSKKAILQKTIHKPQPTLWYKRSILHYAAAAMVVMSLSVGFWLTRQPVHSTITAASISDDEIISYLSQSDLKDIPATEISFVSANPTLTAEEMFIINQADEQLLLEEL